MKYKKGVFNAFWYWIEERHHIYLSSKVEKKPWPWTEDEILKTYKFTNPFRENDTGTIWYRENWRIPYADHPELYFNTCLYRQFNWLETAAAIGFTEEWRPMEVELLLRKRKEEGHRIYTNAHMTTGTLGGDKIEQTVYKILSPLWDKRRELEPKEDDTLQSSFDRLRKMPGFGKFTSYEVITDLRWTRYLENAPDINTWANPGPGAKRGIRRLLGLNARGKWEKPILSDEENIEHMRYLHSISRENLAEWVPELELREIEHSLCEFDKYMRVLNGEGRPRMKFVPPHKR